MPRQSRDQSIIRLAGSQHGMVAARQLRALGIDRRAVWRRVRSGLLTAILPGVYGVAAAGVRLTDDGLRSAAVLACTAPAALGMETAAVRLGIWSRSDGHVHVVSRGGRRPTSTHPISWHRMSTLEPSSMVTIDGIPATDVSRTCFDLGRTLTPWQLAHVLHEAAFRTILDIGALERLLQQHRPTTGRRVVRQALELHLAGCAGTRSRTEDRLLEGILAAGLPQPHVNTRGALDVRGIEPDFAWPKRKLVVEVDGPAHEQPWARKHDALRDEALVLEGWRVLRFSSARVWQQRARVVRSIARALG